MATVGACHVLFAFVLPGVLGCMGAMDDGAALVQELVSAHQQHGTSASSSSLSRQELMQRLASNQMPSPTRFNCERYPLFCEPPYLCQTFGLEDQMHYFLHGLASDGKPNLRSWCMAPQYYDYMTTCLAGDLAKAGRIQYQWSLDQHNGVDELDGSYCFLEGHCSNTAVTNATTLDEAVEMCDDRYGREGWTVFSSAAHMARLREDMKDMPQDHYGGFHYRRHTAIFLKAACAMGNYHCDVQYCKETYCQNPYYIKKYGHLLPKAPGHLLQSKDWIK